jgi:hypothetical protein
VETFADFSSQLPGGAVAARRLPAGGRAAVESDGRPLSIEAGTCRAMTEDRGVAHQCRRRGWFALQQSGGLVILPLCATHLRRLAARGGAVIEAKAG